MIWLNPAPRNQGFSEYESAVHPRSNGRPWRCFRGVAPSLRCRANVAPRAEFDPIINDPELHVVDKAAIAAHEFETVARWTQPVTK